MTGIINPLSSLETAGLHCFENINTLKIYIACSYNYSTLQILQTHFQKYYANSSCSSGKKFHIICHSVMKDCTQ